MAKTIKKGSKMKGGFEFSNILFFPGRKNYSFWLDKWLLSKKVFVKESTYIRYKNHIDNHIKPALGDYPLRKINTALVENYVTGKLSSGRLDGSGGLSQKTMSDIIGVIKGSLKYARSYGTRIICSFDNVPLRHSTKEMRVLSPAEEQRLLSVLFDNMDRYKLGVFLCLYTGIRLGELCALSDKYISLIDNTLKVEHTMQRLQRTDKTSEKKTQIIVTAPKSPSAKRIIPLPSFVVDVIKPFIGSENNFILTGANERFIEPRTMQNRFKTYLKKAKIEDANFHALRHTFATRCVEAGVDIKTLSELLGHSSVKITLDKYVHSSMTLKRSNMEKLDPNFFYVKSNVS